MGRTVMPGDFMSISSIEMPRVQDAVPAHVIVLAQAAVAQHLGADIGGQVALHKGADFLPEPLFRRGESQIHWFVPSCCHAAPAAASCQGQHV
ncbi:hypothetical protein OR16_28119 [Cupriavidus basilensis OR16]|uniref:Uncharacterized protein n=1 Tax=Cupriavidus basilensis OR16 TaxID=1127483 RepID=H1SBQ8_9BURK|nr:hypothetical protein OR16_28119 [Cupriavidus basilensis OR16]